MSDSRFNVPLGYLRHFVSMLVVVHHAVLAYVPLAPPEAATLSAVPRMWQAFPIVDGRRSPLLGVFVAFNDISMMALMFFLSGLFVWGSLQRRGARDYLRSRALRLAGPFAAAALVVAPLAYYATYLRTAAPGGPAAYAREWLALGTWPSGPAWFIWMLLAFDLLVVVSAAAAPRLWPRLAQGWSRAAQRPWTCFLVLVGLSAAAYVLGRAAFGPYTWFTCGPFYGQSSRVLIYFLYFALGMITGMQEGRDHLLSPDGPLARNHVRWMVAAVLVFGLAITIFVTAVSHRTPATWWGAALMYPLCCAVSNLALVGLFLGRVSARRGLVDDFGRCAYGVYLVHYPFVTWLQLALLGVEVHPVIKAGAVSGAALAASWGTVRLLRTIPAVARVI